MRRNLLENRRRTEKDIIWARRNVDEAFSYGEPVVIRTKVREQDADAIHCVRCWDSVRIDAGDPNCSACHGSGWIHSETLTGYRLRVFSRAHIRPLDDDFQTTELGLASSDKVQFWLNFTERELRNDDLIARVEPDDVVNPTFVNAVHDMFEVVAAVQPSLMPQYHPENNPYIMAQHHLALLEL